MCQVLVIQLVKEEIKMSDRLNMRVVVGLFLVLGCFLKNKCSEHQTTYNRKSK